MTAAEVRGNFPGQVSGRAGGVPDLGQLPGGLPVPWEEIEKLREEVAEELSTHAGEGDQRERARAVIARVVARWSQQRSRTHHPLQPADEEVVRQAVFDAQFRAGPLQRYLDMEAVEEITVDSDRLVLVDRTDRPRAEFGPLVDSGEALVSLVNRLAERSGHGERQLTQASPMIHFRLPDRSRAVATLLAGRPSLVVRRHRLLTAGLHELREWGAISPAMLAFLIAAVLARKSILVAGTMRSGKTTLLRGLARVVPAGETIVTLETDRELWLDEDRDTPGVVTGGAHVIALEERRDNGEGVGAVTVADMLPDTLRFGASRVVVGEVRDAVAARMLEATSAGGLGSLTTVHVNEPGLVVPRLEQLCLMAGLPVPAARALIAGGLDLVVYLHQESVARGRRRYVSHIWEISRGEDGGPAMTPVFEPRGAEPRGLPAHLPQCLEQLEEVGFTRQWLTTEVNGQWPAAGSPSPPAAGRSPDPRAGAVA